jgi:type I restriction enzyme S subunit
MNTKILKQKILQTTLSGKWKTVKLGEVLFPMETKKPNGTTFGYIDIDAIDNKQHLIREPKIIDVSNAPSRASRGLKYGDTLFSMVRPYLENIAFVEKEFADCIASTGFFVCRPKDTILPKYLYYLMLSPFVIDGLNSFMKGDNSPSINNANIISFQIPLPPLAVQKSIVERIETLFAEIDRIEQSRQNLLQAVKLAKQKVLAELLNNDEWKSVKLGEVLFPMETKKPIGTTFGYIDIDAIDNKQHLIREPKIIDVSNAPSRASRGLKYGDTLFSMVRPYLENIAFVKEEFADCIASTGFFVCRPKDTILPKYLYYLMLSPFVVDGLNSFMKGDNSPSINNANIISFPIPLPPLTVQQQIVAKIERIFAEIERIEKAVKIK